MSEKTDNQNELEQCNNENDCNQARQNAANKEQVDDKFSKYGDYNRCSEATIKALKDDIFKELDDIRTEIKKPRRKILIFISIILFIYASMFFVLATTFSFTDLNPPTLTADNTVRITAKITKIQPIPYRIKVEGYDAAFAIYHEGTVTDMDELARLSVGQTITFRISSDDVDLAKRLSSTVELVELESNKDIITLQSYNEYYNVGDAPPILAFFILGLVFAGFGVLCIYKYKRKKPIKKLKSNTNR